MASGIARSVTGDPSGFFEMMYLQARPASFTYWISGTLVKRMRRNMLSNFTYHLLAQEFS